jgi:putative cardiolipin synthase
MTQSRPAGWLLVAALSLCGCVYLPTFEDAVVTHAWPPDPASRIGARLGQASDGSPRALLIESPELALTSRIDMIEAADTSIDAQYFIWQNDPTGILVVEKLLAAADRGVRVRGLLDDVQLDGLVDRLGALDEHPNIEIRIFNPFSVRLRFALGLFRLAEFAIDGNRLNHRMHNKLLVADNQLAILGGRNIGDDYFGRSEKRNFIDTDILLSGEIVPELSSGFDTYWNSEWAYPVRALVNWSLVPVHLDTVRERIRKRLMERPELRSLARESAFEDVIDQLLTGPRLVRSTTVIDDPDVGWSERPDEIAADLTEIALTAQREVLIVSPYLIPTANLLEIARTLIDRGVKITVLTNSLASNDVVIAHASYARYRKGLIEAGVDLYEMRGDPEIANDDIAENISLHSKYIIFDDDIVFIGSMNLDPRSLYVNTELGVVLESPELADSLRESFQTWIGPENAWRVTSTPDGLRWQSSAGVVDRQPAKGSWQRWRSRLLSLLPVSSQL